MGAANKQIKDEPVLGLWFKSAALRMRQQLQNRSAEWAARSGCWIPGPWGDGYLRAAGAKGKPTYCMLVVCGHAHTQLNFFNGDI